MIKVSDGDLDVRHTVEYIVRKNHAEGCNIALVHLFISVENEFRSSRLSGRRLIGTGVCNFS